MKKAFLLFALLLVLATLAGATALPLLYFRQTLTTPEENGVGLEWSTAPESSKIFFALERAKNHETWTLLKVQEGFGRPDAGAIYRHVDPPIPHLAPGSILEYRLIAMWDGRVDTSLVTIRWGMCSTFEIARFTAARRLDGSISLYWDITQCDGMLRSFELWRTEEGRGGYKKIFTTSSPVKESTVLKQFEFLDWEPAGKRFSYQLVAILWNGWKKSYEPLWFVGPTTGITPVTPTQPEEFALAQNYPNPFNPSTEITYTVAAKSKIMLAVYNMMGQKIATLYDGEQVTGTYRAIWNAKDEFGHVMPSGIYFCRIEAEGMSKTIKMTLTK